MNLEINYSKSNRSSGHCRVRMRSSGKKSAYIGETKHVHSQCCTLTPASISKTEGWLRSVEVSHAVACTTKVT